MANHKALKGRQTLYKTMFGSRLYGTNTPSSDIDWKEVFLPEKAQLLIGRKPTNVVVSTGGDKTRNTKDDVDYEYIPIQVFANDFIGGQTYALELAFGVLQMETNHAGQVLTDDSNLFRDFVYDMTKKFLTSNIKAMIGYAMNQAQIYGIKGTRLASVRKLHDHLVTVLETTPSDARLEVLTPWVEANKDKYLFMATYEHMDKMLPAISVLEKLYPSNITLAEALDRVNNLMSKYGSRAEAAEQAAGIDWKATAHAVRITKQAIQLLRDKKLSFPFPQEEVDLLLSIKHGERTFEEVSKLLEDLFVELDEVKEKTELPERSDLLLGQFEGWLKDWMMRFYAFYDARVNSYNWH